MYQRIAEIPSRPGISPTRATDILSSEIKNRSTASSAARSGWGPKASTTNTFHIAKIAGALAMSAKGELEQDEIRDRRLPDTVLFGVELHTAMGVRLPDLGREVRLPAD